LILRLADTQQQLPVASAVSASSVISSTQPRKQPTNQPPSSFSESFISNGKQGDGGTVLREGHGIVTRETCNHYSLNINILGKAPVLHFAHTLFWDWGRAKLSLQIIEHNCAYVNFS
jgi:hypothetical protein